MSFTHFVICGADYEGAITESIWFFRTKESAVEYARKIAIFQHDYADICEIREDGSVRVIQCLTEDS